MKRQINNMPDNTNLLAETFDELREFFFYIVSLPEPDRLFFASIIQDKITDLLLERHSTTFHHSQSRFTRLYFELGSPKTLSDFATRLHKQILETRRPFLQDHDMEDIERLLPNSGYTEEMLVEGFMDATVSEHKRVEYMGKLCAHFPEAFTEIINNRLEEILNQDVGVAFVNRIIENLHRKRVKLTNKLETWRSLRRYSKRVKYAINTPDDDYRTWQKCGELDR